jgi:hypothetical protein
LADHHVRYSFGPFNFLFFQSPTETLVECPKESFNTEFHGLINFDQIRKCKITTKAFTLLPKSTATGLSTFINKTSAVSVLDNEWLKVTVKFDKKSKKEQDKDPNPWNRIDIETNSEDDKVELFGSHTILVHSISMFLVVILLLILFAICIMNFMKHMPEPFRSLLAKIGLSQRSVVAESIATPED